MKQKLHICFLALLCSTAASAQISRGAVLLGGSINGHVQRQETGNNEAAKTRGLYVSPSIGFAFKENQVLGVTLGYGVSKYYSEGSTGSFRNKDADAGIFYRRYMPLGKRFYLFGEGGANYSYSKYAPQVNLNRQQYTAALYAYPGVTFAVTKRFQLEASLNNLVQLGFTRTRDHYITPTSNSYYKSNDWSLSSNVRNATPIAIGFRFQFGK